MLQYKDLRSYEKTTTRGLSMKHIRLITALLGGMIAVGGIGIVPHADEIKEETADNIEKDYSYLDDMTINELKELDAEIHKRIPYIDSSDVILENKDDITDGSAADNSTAIETTEEIFSIDDIYGKWMNEDMEYAIVIAPNGTLFYYYLVDNISSIGGTGDIQEYTDNGFILYNNGGEFEYSIEDDNKKLTCVATGIIPSGTVLRQYEDVYSIGDLRFDWVGETSGNHIIIRDNDFSFVDKIGASSTDLTSSLLLIGEYLYNFRFGLLKIEKQGNDLLLTSDHETYVGFPLNDAG
jgi:hypothetical protein